MNLRNLLKFFVTFSFIVIIGKTSFACMYGPPYRTVCDTYNQADSVIIGEIESVSRNNSIQKVIIKVNKTYKGDEQKRIVVNQPQSTCDWDFSDSVGKTILLYLIQDKKTKTFTAISEGMGGNIEKESENLYWLNNLPMSLNRTRISGKIELYQDKPFEFLNYIIGTKVKIYNEKNSYEAKTDKNGVYEIWDIPVGKYKITPEIPKQFFLRFSLSRGEIEFKQIDEDQVDTEDFTVEIQPNSCGGADYVLKNKP